MGRACCVLGCPSGGDAPSHQIPKNPALFQKWKSMIYSEKIKHMTDEQISKCAVCYRHFADDDYLVTFRVRKLKRGIAPSLNLPNKSSGNCKPSAVDVERTTVWETSDESASPGTSVKKHTMESQKVIKMETNDVALFEDLPEEAPEEAAEEAPETDFCVFKQSPLMLYENTEHINSTEVFELYSKERTLRRHRARLMGQQLKLLQCKKQAERYEKTPTVQKLLSFLTPADVASIKTRIRKSKYSPKVYVQVYHDIAKQRALDQL